MTLAHIKAHWLKYYLGVGAVWTAYNFYTYSSTRNVMSVLKGVALWPLDMYQTFSGQTSQATATQASLASQSTTSGNA